MIESEIILSLQRAFNSSIGRVWIAFCARWLIYVYLLIPLSAKKITVFRSGFGIAAWSALLAFAFTSGIAAFIGRVRPYLAIKGVVAIVPPNIQAGSFPSSHTAISFAIAASIFSVHQGWGIAAFAIAFLIAFGRVAAGMHYPSDVLGGLAVGLLAFGCVSIIQIQLKQLPQ
jgi:membrane-associated phospholipid phosphatase